MKGTVCGIGRNKIFYAVRTDLGYTVFELHDGDAVFGDVVTGDLDSHGSVTLRNETQGGSLNACIQAIQATKQAAESLLQS